MARFSFFKNAEAPGLRHPVMGPLGGGIVDLHGGEVGLEGWVAKDAGDIIRGRLMDFIRKQTAETAKVVQEFVVPRHALGTRGYRMNRGDPGPGFTRKSIEGHYYDDTSPDRRGSLFGKVRLHDKLIREPGGKKYDEEVRPYIAAAVLNKGRYGGYKVTRVRVTASGARKRQSWVKGAKRQKPLNFWYLAYRKQRPKFDAFRAEVLVRGIE